MTEVTKSIAEVYSIALAGEYATIVVDGWKHAARAPREQGQILIHSSFGSWGYFWPNIGRPLKEFLQSVTFDSFMGKLMPNTLREFDYDASIRSWKRHLIAARRSHLLDDVKVAEIWTISGCGLADSCGLEMFLHRLDESRDDDVQCQYLWEDIASHVVYRYNPQAQAFWEQLWPLFTARLRQDAEARSPSCSDRPKLVAIN